MGTNIAKTKDHDPKLLAASEVFSRAVLKRAGQTVDESLIYNLLERDTEGTCFIEEYERYERGLLRKRIAGMCANSVLAILTIALCVALNTSLGGRVQQVMTPVTSRYISLTIIIANTAYLLAILTGAASLLPSRYPRPEVMDDLVKKLEAAYGPMNGAKTAQTDPQPAPAPSAS